MNENNDQAELERMNQNNNSVDDSQDSFLDRITSKDVLSITSDFFPSIVVTSFIVYALASTERFCDNGFIGILKAMAFIYSAYIIKSIIHTILIYVNTQNTKFSKISMNTMTFILSTAYYSSVIVAYFIYKQRPDECFITNTFPTMLLFCLVFLGMVNICRHILNIFMIILCFPIMVFYFLRNPQSFYSNFGIDPEIVKNLPTQKAEAMHVGTTCIICMNDLVDGDDILILRCPGRHFFHSNCIKDWLVRKVACPICRYENVL